MKYERSKSKTTSDSERVSEVNRSNEIGVQGNHTVIIQGEGEGVLKGWGCRKRIERGVVRMSMES